MTRRKAKKKILFAEYFSSMGGGQVVMLGIIKILRKYYDIKVMLFNRGDIERGLKKLKVDYFIVAPPKTVKNRYFWEMIPFKRKLRKAFMRENPDILYVNGYFSAKLAASAANALNVPVIWHKHVMINKRRCSYMGFQIRHFARGVNKIICVSNAVKKSLIRIGVAEDKLKVIYNGVEAPPRGYKKNRMRIRKKHGIKKEFVAGAVGFLRRGKGFDIFLKAAEKISGRAENIKFIITGKGCGNDSLFERELKEFAAEKGIEKKIVFTGYGDRFKYVPAFDILVVPFLNEGFGMVAVEAQAMGVPVLGFKSGGVGEIIKDGYNGFFVKKYDSGVLADKIIYLSGEKKLLKKTALHAAKEAKKRFDVKRQAKKIKAVIEEAVK